MKSGCQAISAGAPSPRHGSSRPWRLPIRYRRRRLSRFGGINWGLRQAVLIVLIVFHLDSAFSRRNPAAAISAFRHAFGDAADKVLMVTVVDPGGGRCARRHLAEAIAGACNIRVIGRTLSAQEMTGLMAAADNVISLHRAEGFGLVPAQATQLGRPVVATGWSGNLDLMTEGISALVSYSLEPVYDPEGTFDMADQHWAEADVDHAAEWLKRLRANPELRAGLESAGAADVTMQFRQERFAQRVVQLLTHAR